MTSRRAVPRGRSNPPRWNRRSASRRWGTRLAPSTVPPKPPAIPRLWRRVRRTIWTWWLWGAGAVYALATDHYKSAIGFALAAFAFAVTRPREKAPALGLDHEFSTSSDEFLASMVGATGVAFLAGNSVTVLNNGDRFYPAMLEAVKSAQRSITMEAYIYWDGEVGRLLADAIAERAAAGVKVKILLDAIGSSTIGDDILGRLQRGDCQVAWYNPIRWYNLDRFNNRTHRKSLIVDGRVAFTGGAGIADQWRGDARSPEEWRDLQVRIEGPGAMPLQTGFAHNWLETTGELVSGEEFYPPAGPTPGRVDVQTILSSPAGGSSSVRIMYYLAIACARDHVWIENPYFVPDEVAIRTLTDAAARGVDVTIIVSGRYNDNRLARLNSRRLYGYLLEGGVRILEYNRTMLHQKTMVVDGLFATVGTTNFDNRSFSLNEENNVCFVDRTTVAAVEAAFMSDADASDEVELDAWRRRGWVAKGSEFLAQFLKDQV